MNLPDQATITGSDSSITVSFTSYDNLGAMFNMNSNFSSSVLSVNVLGVEKVKFNIGQGRFRKYFSSSLETLFL